MGWADRIKGRLKEIQQINNDKIIDTGIRFGKQIVAYSPTQPFAVYAHGVFINSWYPAINEFDPTIGALPDLSGTGSLARLEALRGSNAFLSQDGFISISNNLNYAYKVEYAGWIKTGPYAPVRKAVIWLKGDKKV